MGRRRSRRRHWTPWPASTTWAWRGWPPISSRCGAVRTGPGERRARGPMSGPFDRLLRRGNVVVDVVLTVPALPARGGDVLATSTETTAGGGFNVMAAARRQGLPVSYAGAIGSGPFAAVARAQCAAGGIEVMQSARPGGGTGVVGPLRDPAGERPLPPSPPPHATPTPP